MLEQLEELLISTDMGVGYRVRSHANMPEGRFGKRLSVMKSNRLLATDGRHGFMDPDRETFADFIQDAAGCWWWANGSGKRPPMASSRVSSRLQARTWSSQRAILFFGPPRSEQFSQVWVNAPRCACADGGAGLPIRASLAV